MLKWCPLREDLLVYATWIDFTQRLECTFSSVEYFLRRYPYILSEIDIDSVNEEFLSYQTMVEEDIPEKVRESVGLTPDQYHRVDLLWGYLRTVKKPGTNTPEFGNLFKLHKLFLQYSIQMQERRGFFH